METLSLGDGHSILGAGVLNPAKQKLTSDEGGYNHWSSIDGLPEEILVLIFKLAESAPEDVPPCPEATAPFNVSQVSRRWREIALNAPNIWTSIYATNPSAISTLIARSRDCPLDIEFIPVKERRHMGTLGSSPRCLDMIRRPITFQSAATTLCAHIHRWRSARLHELDVDNSANFLCSPAPRLEVFHAARLPIPWERTTDFEREPISCFHNHTPRLRDLSLTQIQIPLTSPIYAGLEKLHLSSIFFKDTQATQFIQVLAACPLLEELTVREVSFSSLNHTGSQIIVSLPRLRSMNLDVAEHHARYLLAFIQAPAELVLSVVMNHMRTTPSIAPHFDAGALERFPGLARIHSINVEHDERARCCAVVGTSSPPSEAEIFKITYRARAREAIRWTLSDLGLRFPLPSLEHLALSSFASGGLEITTFVGVLENLPTITSLALTDCPPSFIYALRVDAGSYLVCPQLRRLWLEFRPPPDTQRLFEVIESRANSNRLSQSVLLAEASAPLFHLTLRGSSVFDWEIVPKLQQLSVVVDWAKSGRKISEFV